MWEGWSPDTPWMVLLCGEHPGNSSKHSCPTPGCPACVSRLTLSSTGSPCPRHVASPAPALLAPLPMPVQWKQPYASPASWEPQGLPSCLVSWRRAPRTAGNLLVRLQEYGAQPDSVPPNCELFTL